MWEKESRGVRAGQVNGNMSHRGRNLDEQGSYAQAQWKEAQDVAMYGTDSGERLIGGSGGRPFVTGSATSRRTSITRNFLWGL